MHEKHVWLRGAALWGAAIWMTCGLAACGSKSKKPAELTVTSYAPDGASYEPSPSIQLQFGAPVVPEEQVGAKLTDLPIELEPEVGLEAHWLDRQTLVAVPTAELSASTRYKVSLRGPLSGRTGDFTFSFVQMPLAIQGVGGETLDRLPSKPNLALQFNQKVAAGAVLEHCRLRVPGSKDAIALETPDPKLEESSIVVSPKTPLAQGGDYELVCEGLTGLGGNAAMGEAFVQALHTYPALAITEFLPAPGNRVPADEVSIEIQFSNPVQLEDVRSHVSLDPATPGIAEGWLDGDGMRYKVTLNLETTTDYTLTVAAGLTDTHGQKLASLVTHSFETSDARPSISMETGIYALETVATGYPVWSRNVASYDVECAGVGKTQVTKVLTSPIDYGGWSESEEALEWEKLGLKEKVENIKIENAKNKWHLDHLDLGKVCGAGSKSRGVYLAQVRSEDVVPDPDREWSYRPYQRALVNVTDLGLFLKVGDGSGILWVTRFSDGQPVAGAKVSTYNKAGKRTFTGTTGADGLVRLPGRPTLLPPEKKKQDDDEAGEYEYGYGGYGHAAERVIAVVETTDDYAVVDGNWSDGIEAWNFGVSQQSSNEAVSIRGFIQSDRGIYRPGETVHFKGLVREVAVGKPPAVPQRRNIQVTVESSRGSTLLEKQLTLTSFGGFHFDLPLTADAQVGDYHVKATLGSTTFRESFSVEEFRAVSFEIDVTTPKRHTRMREPIAVDVAARYLFGEPVASGEVKWNVERRRHRVNIPKFSGFAFSDYAAEGSYYWYQPTTEYGLPLVNGEGVTGKDGKLRFTVNDPADGTTTPHDYVIEVTVKDPTDQAVQKSVVVTGHQSDHYLGLRTKDYVSKVEDPLELEVVAVSPTGDPVAAKGTLSAIRSSWECNYEAAGYRSYPRCERKETLVTSREIALAASGPKTESLKVTQPGSYILRLEGTDARGNKIASSTYAWVTGAGNFGWGDSEENRMTLIASKPSYEPGETARLVPQSSLQGAVALVTLERGGILDARVQRLSSASEGIDVALSDVHAPNVYASVAMVRGRTGPKDQERPRFQMGIAELKVSSASKRLAVKITTDKDTYQPGETVTGTIRVTSADAPVRAEVSLSVADEGVLQLIAYQTPDPMPRFYAQWGLGVDNASSWSHLARLNDPSDVDMEYGADYEGGPGEEPGRVRSRFVSSAYWAPALVTNENGEIPFTFESPDNLTAFRLMAVAADEGARFGSGEHRITIKKPLLAKPVLPRFFTAGDRGEVGVVIHNYTGADGTVEVTAKAEGAKLQKDKESVKIAAGDSARIRFPVRVGDGKDVSFEFAARMGAHSDALRMLLPVNRPYIYQRKVLARGELGKDGKMRFELPLSWDAELVARDSIVTVTVDRTGMSDLEPGLRYLIEYPYGCLEQTLSRFIPLTKVKDLARSLELADLEKTKLDDFVRAGAAKVARHQDLDSGHFTLWPGSEPYPHLTVYALYGLNEAKRARVRVDEKAMTRGLEAMRDWARSTERKVSESGEAGTMAMAAYLLAELGQPDTGLNARLFEAHRALPRYGQAFLLRALHLSKAPAEQRQAVEAALLEGVDGSGATALIKETQPDDYYMDSDVRSTAIALSSLLVANPNHPLVPKLAEGLLQAQTGGRWSNTQENLYALVALADYARRLTAGKATVTVSKGKERELRRRIEGNEALVLRRSVRNLDKGPVVIETDGPVRYTVRVDEARKIKADAPVSDGFTVKREYLDPGTGRPLTRFKAGALVHVKVTVNVAQNTNYIAVVDPLPAGLEVVNPRFATVTSKVKEEEEEDEAPWEEEADTWTYRELRDDEARAFADYLSAGDHTFEYLARATLPGEFLVLPARAEAMYKPDRNGRSVAIEVNVRQ